jgi:hypothetical protein
MRRNCTGRFIGLSVAMLLCAVIAGCGRSTDGPKRYPLSGTVTYNGQPVPKGFITLEPDAEKGNSGPGGADIVNGKYDTRTTMGIVGGHYRVRITGTDGVPVTIEGEELPDGKPLFPPYETTIEFPAAATVQNFEIPAGK